MMNWVSKDIEVYLGAKEYVDTAVLPLLPVSFGPDIKQAVSMTEFITLLSIQLERQFKGRLLMLPGYTYLKQNSEDKLIEEINGWHSELVQHGFKHIFYVTSDSDWRARETKIDGNVIWLPSLPLENLDPNSRNTILEDQVKQLLNLFVQKWQENE